MSERLEEELLGKERTRLVSLRLTRTPSALRVFAAAWGAFLAAAALFVAFVPWTQSVVGSGIVTVLSPMMRPQTVNAGFDARLASWRVREGDRVAAGQVIAELAEYRPEYLDPRQLERTEAQRRAAALKKSAAEAQLRSYDQLVAALRRVGRAHLPSAELRKVESPAELDDSARRLFAAERQVVLVARQNYERVKALHAEGLKSTRDLELAEREIAKAEGDVEAKLLETELKRAAAVEKLASLEGELLKAETDLARLRERVDQRFVKAPIAGQIVRLFGVGAGHTFKSGEPMAVVAPEVGDQAVELMLSDHDAPLVAPGRQARIQFAGWPAVQMSGWPSVAAGTFAGRIAAVDASNDGSGRFRVLVAPDAEAISSGREPAWPSASRLRVGTQAAGWILLERVPLWFELWRRFNGFPPTMRSGEPTAEAKSR